MRPWTPAPKPKASWERNELGDTSVLHLVIWRILFRKNCLSPLEHAEELYDQKNSHPLFPSEALPHLSKLRSLLCLGGFLKYPPFGLNQKTST